MGSIAGLSLLTNAIQNKDWSMAISGIATMILGLLSKDSDVH